MQIVPTSVPLSSSKWSGRGSIGVAAVGDLMAGTVTFGMVLADAAEEALPHVQLECSRRAGFGKVLYVEPRDVYLRRNR